MRSRLTGSRPPGREPAVSSFAGADADPRRIHNRQQHLFPGPVRFGASIALPALVFPDAFRAYLRRFLPALRECVGLSLWGQARFSFP